MTQRSLVLRLIDLGLLVLMGFLNIADIVQESHLVIESPQKTESLETQDQKLTELRVMMHQDRPVFLFVEQEMQGCFAASYQSLRDCFSDKEAVVLKFDKEVPFQVAVDVLDLCKEAQIACTW